MPPCSPKRPLFRLLPWLALAGCLDSSAPRPALLANPISLEAGPPSSPAPPPLPERTSCQGLTLGTGTWDETLVHAGQVRHYRVHVPEGYAPTRPTPVVLAFHGYAADEREQEALSRLSDEADARGFIAVYPRALEGEEPAGWNAGICCGTGQHTRVDDVGFVDTLLAELDSRVCVDTQRVYATGFSNGGFFAYRLACERAEQFAAIAPVASVEGYGPCTPARPVAVMHFHGTRDATIAYEGGTHPLVAGPFPSARESVERWAWRDGCTIRPVTTWQRGDSTCESALSCDEGSAVILCTVNGGGHTWPGGLVPPELGATTHDLDATREMWRFFSAHPRR